MDQLNDSQLLNFTENLSKSVKTFQSLLMGTWMDKTQVRKLMDNAITEGQFPRERMLKNIGGKVLKKC